MHTEITLQRKFKIYCLGVNHLGSLQFLKDGTFYWGQVVKFQKEWVGGYTVKCFFKTSFTLILFFHTNS